MKLGKYSFLIISWFLITNSLFSQSLANYSTLRSTGIVYTSISATGNAIDSWRNNAGLTQDDNRSNSTSIGFDYWYNGIRYTQFSVSTNGYLDFSNNAADGGPTTGPYGYDNAQFTGNGSGTWLALAPFYDDMTAQGGTAALGNSIKYLVTGVAPNRVLTVEWINMAVYGNTTPSLNFQVKLYETSGVIEFVYGTMTAGSHSFSYTCGINGAVLANGPSAAQLLLQQTANTNTFSNGQQNSLVTVPATNSKISFTPTTPLPVPSGAVTFTAVTQTGMTVNWPNWCGNEAGYVIYNSIDNINFSFVSQAAINATSYVSSGLMPSTTYYWRVYAVTDGTLSAFLTASRMTNAAGAVISIATGNWNTPATWNCGCVPTASDNVTISNTHTVTVNVNSACNNLIVGGGASGILQIGSGATKSLAVNGNITINNGAVFRVNAASTAVNTLSINGNIINNGTLNFSSGVFCDVTFLKNGNQSISGTGVTNNFNKIVLNMGTSINNTLDVVSTNFSAPANFLSLINGTFKLSTTGVVAITPYNVLTTIPNTTGITVNSANATVNFSNGINLYGNLIINSGTLNIGSAADHNVASNGGTFQIFGGTTRIAGRYYSANINTLAKFTISGGTITLPTVGSTSTTVAPFQIDGVGSTFNMSGGTIILQKEGGAGPQNLGFTLTGVSNNAVTGGTLQIGNAATPATQIMNINSSSRIGNLTINSANATGTVVTNALNVTQNVNITLGTLNANNLNISLGGTWTNNSTFTPGTGTVIFNGTIAQTLAGTVVTAFRNLTISNATGVSLGLNTSVSGILNFTAGVINTGANKVSITATGSVTGAGTSKFVNGFLEKNIATGANIARTFEVGSGITDYLPLNLNFTSVGTAGNITAKVNNGDHPNIGTSCIDPLLSVNRYWTLTNAGTVFTNYSATGNFIVTDVDAGSTTANYFMSVYNAGVWTMLAQGSALALSNQGTGITTMGDLQIGEKKKPVITVQPTNVSLCSGAAAAFSVTATGAGLTYQWQQNNGGGFVNLANGGAYSGVTTAALNISPTIAAMNNYQFRCIVTVACGGSVTSNAAILTVTPSVAASVSIAASATTICAGTNVTFTATPTNGGAAPVYQWKVNGVNVGANSTTYSSTTLGNGNTVTCVMTSNAVCASGSPATSNTITMTVNPNLPVSVSISATATTICPGTNVTFTATPTNGGAAPTYQWKKNGVNIGGATSSTYSSSTLTNGNVITCVLTSNATPCATGSPATSNSITMTVNSSLPVSVSIAASPSNIVCAGTTVTFTATPTNGGTTPTYQWKKGGVNIAGATSSTYSTATLVTGDVITCVLTAGGITCGVGSPATSNSITMTVNANVPASVSISANPAGAICSGTNVTFTATPTNGGATPTYQWKLNGVNVGANSATYSNAALGNGNTIVCIMTSSLACTTGSPSTSNIITMTVNPSLPVSVSISASPAGAICSGTNVTFTASPTNGGGSPIYQWKLNGVNVGSNSTTYSNSSLANGDVVTNVLTSNAGCATGNPATSNAIITTVNPNLPASVSISANPAGTICAGTSVTFTASPTNGGGAPAYQWKLNGVNAGANSSTYSNSTLINGDIITAVLTSNAVCVTGNPATSNSIVQSVNSTGTWLGVSSDDWQDPTNWCGGVPTITSNVSVANGTAFNPILSANSFAKNINISAGATIDLNSFILNVAGSFSGTGTIKGSPASSINIVAGVGTAGTFYMDQSDPGNSNSLFNITMNRAGSVIVGDTLDLINEINISTGTLDANGRLILVSDATQTARIAELVAGADVIGNVTMQRYIPAGTDGWMFICSPVSGATLQQWDDDFVTGGFTGSQYPPSPNPSIVSYNEALPGIYDDGFVGPTNITDPIVSRKGYWAYIMNTPVTIDVTGPILKNLQTFPVTYTDDPAQPSSEDGWNLVANPYPSTIDWDAAGWTKTNINDAIYMYSPTLDQYTSYVGGIGTNGGSNLIASSQAFLVQANGAAPVLKLPESGKVATDGLFIRSTISDDIIKLDLAGAGYKDETVIHFNSSATDNFDLPFDALKFFSFNTDMPGIASMLDTTKMSINTYPLLTTDLSIPIKVKVGISGTYRIDLDSISKLPEGACIILYDRLTGIKTDLRTSSSYTFTISDTTSSPRFEINISKPIQVSSIPSSCSVTPNGSAIASGNGTGPWNYTWMNSAGTVIATHTSIAGTDTLKNISSGNYSVIVSGNSGYCDNMKGIIAVGGLDSIQIVTNIISPTCGGAADGSINIVSTSGGNPPYSYNWSNGLTTPDNNNILPGTYSLTVTDNSGCSQVESFNVIQSSLLSAAFTVSSDTVYLSANTLIDFMNYSSGASSYIWNFGNGGPEDNSENVSYLYKVDGIYTVSLIVSDGNCTDTAFQTIVVLPEESVGINELSFDDQISLANNNSQIDLIFNLNKITDVNVEVFNSIGQQVFQTRQMKAFKNRSSYNFEDKAKGVYFIKITSEDGLRVVKKIVRY